MLKKLENTRVQNNKGAIGYLFAWLLGVPATLLIVIFLLRGGT